MRLVQLTLDAFGFFTNKKINFGIKEEDKSDFHIFYGPNEAGKTTLMKAWQRFLFGIPKNENFAFFQKRQNLKISAEIEQNESTQYLIRKPKGNSSVLVDQNDNNCEQELQNWLRGMSNDDYQDQLFLDDSTIEEGSKRVLESRGKIGELLFSAASGLSDFSQQLDNLKIEADELYKKRAHKTKFVQLKNRYEQLSEKISKLRVSASQYQELKQQAQSAFEDEQRLGIETKTLREKLTRLNILKEKYSNLKQHKKALNETISSGVDALAQLGFNNDDFVNLKPEQIYHKLSFLISLDRDAQSFYTLKNTIDNLKRELQHLENKSPEIALIKTNKLNEINNINNYLPSLDKQNILTDLIANIDIDNKVAGYKSAIDQQQAADERFKTALVELTVKGQNFNTISNKNTFQELPYTPLSVIEAEQLSREKDALTTDINFEEKNNSQLLGQLDFINNQLKYLQAQEDEV